MPSLITYRHALAYALDDLAIHSVISPAGLGFTSLTLVNGDVNASTATYNGRWAFNATKGAQRKTRTNGYTPSAGTLTVDPSWTCSVNDLIELTQLFPCYEPTPLGGGMSYREIANRALQLLIVPARISIPIVPGQLAYSLAPWQKWLNSEDRFGWPPLPDGTPQPRLLEPGPGAGAIPADRARRPALRLDADVPYLDIQAPFAAGASGNLQLCVMRPANTWIFINGSWGESVNDGLVNDTDEARPSVVDVTEIGKLIAFETLAARGVVSATGRWSDKVAPQRAICERIRYFDTTRIRPVASTQPAASGAA